MKFNIEAVFSVQGTACVMAHRMEAGEFSLSSVSRFAGVALQQVLEPV
jgi:translation elongation factor EF-Tu-like GTPase